MCLEKSAARLLSVAAHTAVRQWRYAPATRNGLPVRILLTVTVSFTHPV